MLSYFSDICRIHNILIKNKCSKKFLDKYNIKNNYTLRISATNGHLNVVKYLIKCGADISANNNEALRMSAANGHLNVVKYLLGKKIIVNK